MQRIKSNVKFINLHSHDGHSIFDAIGLPSEHYDFAYSNGMDAMAITNHGNLNSLPYQISAVQKMKEKNIDFKPIFGVEAYFHHSIKEWKEIKDSQKTISKSTKTDEEEVTLTVEDEAESKSLSKNILNKRRHLVLLAQNQKGLNNLFTLISESYQGDNYYRFPRIDYEMLKKHSEGIIASSACLTGDSIVDTNLGQLRLDEMIDKWKNGEEIFILSYDEKQNRVIHKKVVWGDLTRKDAKVIKITLKDGKTLRLTADHKVFTDKGWLEAGEIKKHKGIKILSLT